ncbi:hypothetical protein D3C80_1283770 [compost metagenome]
MGKPCSVGDTSIVIEWRCRAVGHRRRPLVGLHVGRQPALRNRWRFSYVRNLLGIGVMSHLIVTFPRGKETDEGDTQQVNNEPDTANCGPISS